MTRDHRPGGVAGSAASAGRESVSSPSGMQVRSTVGTGGGPEILDLGLAAVPGSARSRPVYEQLEQACAVEFPRLVRLLTVYCGDRETASDMAQETLARACAHWNRVEHMDDQRAWFTRVALNVANSRWRRLLAERKALARVPVPSLEFAAVDLAMTLTVRQALAALTPRQRAAVVLRYFEDLDLATTATVMECSAGTVKKLTARGLASLRIDLDFDETPEGRR